MRQVSPEPAPVDLSWEACQCKLEVGDSLGAYRQSIMF